ncbi:DUF4337 domain-containing protein [Caenimonas koreensis]|uniref:DUF4337 domain-containing protein n=1 Tax=Caenimonas koreensis TaxID=367474 RepID=UPI0037839326
MDINPIDSVEAKPSRLNAAVAISVALVSTVMGICKVKDDNIVQAMQQAQADKIDHWAYYQARNLREEVAKSTLVQLRLQAAAAKPEQKTAYDMAIASYEKLAADQAQKKDDLRKQAESDQQTYDALNYRDDQFDLADAAFAIAIALLAIASLTQQWGLFLVAMFPSAFGVAMGVAGLAGLKLHPGWLAQLLS